MGEEKAKERKLAEMHGSLVFAINGERFEVSESDPSMTLLEFLRTQTRFKGSKLGCGEGVMNSRYLTKNFNVCYKWA
jgi:xanthine dehydrogenase iron-sulfur cluster and FAD-binding subunit A